jgi:hypothetical protein
MPRRRRVYIHNIEDYLVEPPPPPSRLPRALLRFSFGLLLLANLVLLVGLLFSLIPPNVFGICVAGVIAYSVILLLFLALSKSIHHAE